MALGGVGGCCELLLPALARPARVDAVGWDACGDHGVTAVEEMRRTGPVPHMFVTGNISKAPALGRDAVIIQRSHRVTDRVQAMQRALGVAAHR